MADQVFPYNQLFEREDLTIEQKWLYLVFLYEDAKGNHEFPIYELVRNHNVMAPGSLVERNIHALEGKGLIQAWKDRDTWNISIVGRTGER